MREDPVRMMRAVRFAAKLGFEIEPATRAAIERYRADLAKASRPRLVDETYKTLAQPEAAHALVLMEELGLLEAVMPIVSAHLKSRAGTLAEQAVVRNMAAMGVAIAGGYAPEHSIVLSALMLDLYRDEHRRPGSKRTDLLGHLRACGFARGDTEQMRLILEAFENLASPTRRTRRLMRRPYFPDARLFFEMTAPTYSIDATHMMRWLSDPEASGVPASHSGASEASHLNGPHPMSNGQRRRRRRRRRSRHGGHGNHAAVTIAPSAHAGEGAHHQFIDQPILSVTNSQIATIC